MGIILNSTTVIVSVPYRAAIRPLQHKHDMEDQMTETPEMTEMTEEEEREFYELMQAYRHAPPADQKAVIEAYEAVKTFIKQRIWK